MMPPAPVALILLLYISSTLAANITNSTECPLTFNVSFVIKPDKIPTAIAHLILDDGNSFKNTISTESLNKILNLNSLSSTKLIALIKNATNINITHHLFEIFDGLNISYSETFKDFKLTCVNNVNDLKAFEKFNINFMELMFLDGNETAFKNIFKNGSFTSENISSALKQINKTQEEILNFLQTIVLKKLFDKEISILATMLRPYGLPAILETFFIHLKITPENFKDTDIQHVLKTFEDDLNNVDYKPIATAISPHNLVTTDFVYNTLLNHNFITIDIGNEIQIKNITFTNNYLNISTTTQFTNYIPVATNYTQKPRKCKYMNQNVSLSGFYLNKSNSIFYLSGSPLTCQKNLYGIASHNFTHYIGFTMFNTTILQANSSFGLLGYTWLVTIAAGVISYTNV